MVRVTHLGGAEDTLVAGRVSGDGEGTSLVATQDGVDSSPGRRVGLIQVSDDQPCHLLPSLVLWYRCLVLWGQGHHQQQGL